MRKIMLLPPNCYNRRCRHYEGVDYLENDNEESEVPICPAYLKGIPPEIAYGEDKHLKIRPDQEGDFVFERIKK